LPVGRRSRSSLASEGVAMRTKLVLAVVVAMSLGGCTTTQESIGGGAVGGVAGLAVAGPIGAVAGATAGAVATPMAGWGLN
jgi:osmotically inducible lipoprotein OsmB